METLTEMERLVLMAAAVHGLGPDTDLGVANAAKVVRQALVWAGRMDDEVRSAWQRLEYHPAILECYGTLIRLSYWIGVGRPPERAGEPLMECSGNVGTAVEPTAFPDFTAYRLTPCGEKLARGLLERHPEMRKAD